MPLKSSPATAAVTGAVPPTGSAASTAPGAPSTPPAQVAAAAPSVLIPLWRAPSDTRGNRLPTRFVPNLSGHGRKGRTAVVDPASLADLASLNPGDSVTFPLFGGELVSGRIVLVQADAGNWTRVGGVLTGKRVGTFSLSTNGAEIGGAILLPEEFTAVELSRDADGRIVIEERPIGDVLCTPLPLVSSAPTFNAPSNGLTPTGAALVAPVLSSRPTATAVIYIDFDGETVTDPHWNGGQTIVAAPANLTTSEMNQVWAVVAEDFWPFNIDVTTDVNRYNSAPVNRRTRCIVTPTNTAAPNSGGVAYLSSFSRAGQVFTPTVPCWVFNGGVRGAADSISHEVGHTLGLRHDGRTGEEYYYGHGWGAVGWSPIMGVGFNQQLSQWSKGEYPNASQQEDDLAMIASGTNGFGFVPDDAGNARNVAAPLGIVGNTIRQAGTISAASDSDFYLFSVGAGSSVNLTAMPSAPVPNVDLLIELQDANGVVLATANPDVQLNATLSAFVPAGVYYFRVKGTGRGSVAADGYSDYGSLGAYTLSGSVTGAAQPPTISTIANRVTGPGVPTAAIPFTVGDPDTSVSALIVTAVSSNPALVPLSGIALGGFGAARTVTVTPAAGQTGAATITLTVSDGVLSASTSFVVTATAPTSVPVFSSHPGSQTVSVGTSVTFSAGATGNPVPTFQWQKNGAALAGATGTTLSLVNVIAGDAGTYALIATNSAGSTASNAATLTVNAVLPGAPKLGGQPIGSAPWQGVAAGDKNAVFDGNTATAFDSEAAFIYVGLDLGSPKTIERVRYFPRGGLAFRMTGGRIRGANAPDLSDAVTLHTITVNPPEGTWQDVTLSVSPTTYRYVFFTTGAGGFGNVAELEFFGVSGTPPPPPPPAPPAITSQPQSVTVTAGSPASFTVVASSTGALSYQWSKNNVAIAGATSATHLFATTAVTDGGSYVLVVSSTGGSVTSAAAVLTVNPATSVSGRLSGTPIGSAPWSGLAVGDKNAAFDGNTATAFDSDASFIYVGLDLGTAKTLDRLRYFPRGSLAFRMNGGRIRGANAPDLSDAVTLHTVPFNPPEGTWQDVTLPASSAGYRYMFFTTDGSGFGNLAELEFFGTGGGAPPPPPPPAPPTITSQPQSVTVTAGSLASFTVGVSSGVAVGYQWSKNGAAITGATSGSYLIATTAGADAGSYTVLVSSTAGSVTSAAAVLTVNPVVPVSARLSGTPMGSAPWRGLAAGDKNAAFDGTTATAFDSEASFIYVGLDLGAQKTIDRLRYFPRVSLAFRMNGGRIRGANSADLSDAVTLHTITSNPPEGTWQDVTLPVSPATYRYIFFTTDGGGYGNVAELEFFGFAAAAAPQRSLVAQSPDPKGMPLPELIEGVSLSGWISEANILEIGFTITDSAAGKFIVRKGSSTLASLESPNAAQGLRLKLTRDGVAENGGAALRPGRYIVALCDARAAGAGLLEIVSLSSGAGLADIRFHGKAGRGDRALTAGFVLSGDGAVLRARGEAGLHVAVHRDGEKTSASSETELTAGVYIVQATSDEPDGVSVEIGVKE